MFRINETKDDKVSVKKSEQNSLGKSYLLHEPIKDEINFSSSEKKPKKDNVLLWVVGLGALATGIIIALKKHNPKEIEKAVAKEKNEISQTVNKTQKEHSKGHGNNSSGVHKNNNSKNRKQSSGFSGGGGSHDRSYDSNDSKKTIKHKSKGPDKADTVGINGGSEVPISVDAKGAKQQQINTEEKIIKSEQESKSPDAVDTEGAKSGKIEVESQDESSTLISKQTSTEKKVIKPEDEVPDKADTVVAKGTEETIKATNDAINEENTKIFKSEIAKIASDEASLKLDYSKPSEVISTIFAQSGKSILGISPEFYKNAYKYLSDAKIADPIEAERIKLSKMDVLTWIRHYASSEPEKIKIANDLDTQKTKYLEENFGKNGADIGFSAEDFARLKEVGVSRVSPIYNQAISINSKKFELSTAESVIYKKVMQVKEDLFVKYKITSIEKYESLDESKKKAFIQEAKSGISEVFDGPICDIVNKTAQVNALISSKVDNMLSKLGVSSDSELYKDVANLKSLTLHDLKVTKERLLNLRNQFLADIKESFKTSDEVLEELKGMKELKGWEERKRTEELKWNVDGLTNTKKFLASTHQHFLEDYIKKLHEADKEIDKENIIKNDLFKHYKYLHDDFIHLFINDDPFMRKYDEYLTKVRCEIGISKIPVQLGDNIRTKNDYFPPAEEKTNKPELDNTISYISSDGFRYKDKLLQWPIIHVYKYEA